VCDRCKPAAIKTYDDECVVEPYPEDQPEED